MGFPHLNWKKCNQVNSFVNSYRLDLILLPAMREKFNWAWSLTKETLCIIYLKSSNIKSLIISARRPKTCLTLFFFWPKNRAKTPKVRGQIFIYFLQCNSLRQTKLWLWRNCQTKQRYFLNYRSECQTLKV